MALTAHLENYHLGLSDLDPEELIIEYLCKTSQITGDKIQALRDELVIFAFILRSEVYI